MLMISRSIIHVNIILGEGTSFDLDSNYVTHYYAESFIA